MGDPMICVMERRPVSSGFWVQDFRGGDLIYADAHPEQGPTITTVWPVLNRFQAYVWTRGYDVVLNAAAASRDRLERVFRTLHGVGREAFDPTPSAFWDRLQALAPVTGGDFSAYFGTDATNASNRGQGGLVIDTTSPTGFTQSGNVWSKNISGWSGGSSRGESGQGSGSGGGSSSSSSGGHGGHGTAGGTGGNNGRAVPRTAAIEALLTGNFTADTLHMGGSAGASYYQGIVRSGGASGSGRVVISKGNIVESSSHDLSGERGWQNGSGGGYYVVCRRGFTLASGASIDLGNGRDSATDGKGRLTTFTVDQPTITGTVSNGVLTHFQIYPSVPLGAVRVT